MNHTDDTVETMAIEKMVLTRLMKLNAVILGLTIGFLSGMGIFVATNLLILKGGDQVGPHLALLGQFFIGYEVTFTGSLIGFVYAFLTGFVASYSFARIYNWLADISEARGKRKIGKG